MAYIFFTVLFLIGTSFALQIMISAKTRLSRLKSFRTEWLSIKAKNLTPDNEWKKEWRQFIWSSSVFLGGWLGILIFVIEFYDLISSMKTGGANGLFLLFILPASLGLGGIAGLLGVAIVALFVLLWVKISPIVAMVLGSAPFIVIMYVAISANHFQ